MYKHGDLLACRYPWWRGGCAHTYRFRCDPVPGVHKFSNGRYYRRMRTTQEARYSCDSMHKPYVRGRRTKSMLPNAWDDEIICDLKSKSWKDSTKRRHQWRPKWA